MAKIKVLPEEVARKIAAGEVIERPASVVKELLENALDAGATKVEVELEKGGLSLIRVRDDGCGMSPEDLKVCYLPHATSKIRRAQDLLAISTLGFRGEALASIAAVSRLTIVSRPPEALLGAKLEVSFGKFKGLFEAGAGKGTTVVVEDLFANVPARRAFLKGARAETSRVAEVLRLLALAFPGIDFSLRASGRKLFTYQAYQGRRGLLATFAGVSPEDLLEEAYERGPYRVGLLLSRPASKFPTARHLYFLVNNRAVRDRLLLSALLQGASLAFPKGQYPAAVVALELPPELVDVNVHPAKWEVRFREEREVFAVVREAVERALKPKVAPPPRCEEEDLPLASDEKRPPIEGTLNLAQERVTPSSLSPSGEGRGLSGQTPPFHVQEPMPPYQTRLEARPLGALARKYFLFELPEGLLILDYHAAHERLLYEKIRREYEKEGLAQQRLLFPPVLSLSAKALERLEEHREVIARLGYELSPAGPQEVRLLAVPSIVGERAAEALLTVLEQDLASPPGTILHQVFATLACRAAVKAGEEISPEEALNLWEEIRARGLKTCPHGRPLYWKITHEELEKRLGRKV